MRCDRCGKEPNEIQAETGAKSVWIWTCGTRKLCDFCLMDEQEANGEPLPAGLAEINERRKRLDAEQRKFNRLARRKGHGNYSHHL